MAKQFLWTAIKNLKRNPGFTLVNVLSLALGLAAFSLLMLYVKHELSYNRSWPNASSIHRLVIEQQNLNTGAFGSTASANHEVVQWLRDYFPQDLAAASRTRTGFFSFETERGRANQNLTLVDPAYADIFRPQVVMGDLARAVSNPGLIAVEENFAADFLGPSPLGETIDVEGSAGVRLSFEVAAVFRPPPPTRITNWLEFRTLGFLHPSAAPLFERAFMTRPEQWMDGAGVWLRFRPGADVEALESRLPALVDQHVTALRGRLAPYRKVSDFIRYRFQPLTDIYLNPTTGAPGGNPARILTVAVIGFLVLLVGCSNSISLSMAAMMERRREIGIRKASGAGVRDIRRQFLGENLLLTLLALIPALLLIELLLPAFSSLLSLPVALRTGPSDYGLILAVTLLVGLANGAWPAFVSSRLTPQSALQANAAAGVRGRATRRQLLVAGQFSVALILIIVSLGLYQQLAVSRAQPLGYNPQNLVLVAFGPQADRNLNTLPLIEELKRIPGVANVDVLTDLPNRSSSSGLSPPLVRTVDQPDAVATARTSAGFFTFELLEIPLLAGRSFDRELDGLPVPVQPGEEAPLRKVIINRSTARALGFASVQAAVDQTVYSRAESGERRAHSPYQVVGVVEDNMYLSLSERPGPAVYMQRPYQGAGILLLRYDDAIAATMRESVGRVWEQVTGLAPSNFIFLEEMLAQEFVDEESQGRTLLATAGLALFLSCLGLYGLAAFVLERSVKEVGIRKALGAGVRSIVLLYLARFSRPVLLANLVAWPAALWFLLRWIERFPYQLDRAWLLPLCAAAALAVLALALATVGSLTAKAAAEKPVKSLRYE